MLSNLWKTDNGRAILAPLACAIIAPVIAPYLNAYDERQAAKNASLIEEFRQASEGLNRLEAGKETVISFEGRSYQVRALPPQINLK